jgi:hypothetical protein
VKDAASKETVKDIPVKLATTFDRFEGHEDPHSEAILGRPLLPLFQLNSCFKNACGELELSVNQQTPCLRNETHRYGR